MTNSIKGDYWLKVNYWGPNTLVRDDWGKLKVQQAWHRGGSARWFSSLEEAQAAARELWATETYEFFEFIVYKKTSTLNEEAWKFRNYIYEEADRKIQLVLA